jgi:hypothetical protein
MFYYCDKFPHIGVFYIRPNKENPHDWNLLINKKLLGSYKDPDLAVNAVYMHNTGYKPWDSLRPDPNNPYTLSEWIKVDK